ncbi:MAG: flavodoxin family protein, partial [Deltaproteobacteria bacterium]|nr:flavodoxin family protein [Deltaproteobacteria bacterium]
MSILAICGGLREESNTNKIVKKVAESSGCDFELVYLAKLEIKPCVGCPDCMMNDVYLAKLEIKPCVGCPDCMMNEGKCAIEDDMQELYEKLLNADAIILGSPTYYMDVSGAVKCFIDRSLALYYRGIGPMHNPDMPFLGQRPLAGKLGAVVTTVAG